MARPAEPGRTALLDAGRRLLGEPDGPTVTRLSVNAVVAEAAMSKGAFFQHFPSRRDYLLALHAAFHAPLAGAFARITEATTPGPERLQAAIEHYLDYCLEHPEAKAFLFSARADCDLADTVAAANAHFAEMMVADLVTLGWTNPRDIALLATAAVAEVALAEGRLGVASPSLRSALGALLHLQ
jgi:AcrR family transcriptional regulator